jgi:hypothetical protein
MKFLPLLILCTFVIQGRYNGINVVSQLSGNSSNVGILCMSYREADEGGLGNNLCILLLLASERPLRKKIIQMTGQSH